MRSQADDENEPGTFETVDLYLFKSKTLTGADAKTLSKLHRTSYLLLNLRRIRFAKKKLVPFVGSDRSINANEIREKAAACNRLACELNAVSRVRCISFLFFLSL